MSTNPLAALAARLRARFYGPVSSDWSPEPWESSGPSVQASWLGVAEEAKVWLDESCPDVAAALSTSTHAVGRYQWVKAERDEWLRQLEEKGRAYEELVETCDRWGRERDALAAEVTRVRTDLARATADRRSLLEDAARVDGEVARLREVEMAARAHVDASNRPHFMGDRQVADTFTALTAALAGRGGESRHGDPELDGIQAMVDGMAERRREAARLREKYGLPLAPPASGGGCGRPCGAGCHEPCVMDVEPADGTVHMHFCRKHMPPAPCPAVDVRPTCDSCDAPATLQQDRKVVVYYSCQACADAHFHPDWLPLGSATSSPATSPCQAVEPGTGHACVGGGTISMADKGLPDISCENGYHACEECDAGTGTCWYTPPHPQATHGLDGRPLGDKIDVATVWARAAQAMRATAANFCNEEARAPESMSDEDACRWNDAAGDLSELISALPDPPLPGDLAGRALGGKDNDHAQGRRQSGSLEAPEGAVSLQRHEPGEPAGGGRGPQPARRGDQEAAEGPAEAGADARQRGRADAGSTQAVASPRSANAARAAVEPVPFGATPPAVGSQAGAPSGAVSSTPPADPRADLRAELHRRLERRLSEQRARKPVDPPPRYDEVFAAGTAWLNGDEPPTDPGGRGEGDATGQVCHWAAESDHRYFKTACGIDGEADDPRCVEWPWQVTCPSCVDWFSATGKADLLTELGHWHRCVSDGLKSARAWIDAHGGKRLAGLIFDNGIVMADRDVSPPPRMLSLGPLLYNVEKLLACSSPARPPAERRGVDCEMVYADGRLGHGAEPRCSDGPQCPHGWYQCAKCTTVPLSQLTAALGLGADADSVDVEVKIADLLSEKADLERRLDGVLMDLDNARAQLTAARKATLAEVAGQLAAVRRNGDSPEWHNMIDGIAHRLAARFGADWLAAIGGE